MSTRLKEISFFLIVFLVLLFVGASEARNVLKIPVFTRDQVQIIHNQIEEYDPISENAKSSYFGYIINEINTNSVYIRYLINKNAKSAYDGYLHTKRLNVYGNDWLWRIDFLIILFCFSLLLTNLFFRVFFCITSRRTSARVSKSIV